MPIWSQHLLVLLLVAGCLLLVGWQTFQSLLGRKSRIGSCCAKGCPPVDQKPAQKTERTHFLPADMLVRRK
jgi:hypothetical protein